MEAEFRGKQRGSYTKVNIKLRWCCGVYAPPVAFGASDKWLTFSEPHNRTHQGLRRVPISPR